MSGVEAANRAWRRLSGLPALLALLVALLSAAGASAAERRVALVVGNAAYAHVSPLANPQNDAAAIAAALRRVGFEATELRRDLGRGAMLDALQTFTREARKADVAFVYYAGHGMEVGGRNFLIPTDARLATDDDVEFEAVPLDLVLRAVEGAKRLRLVVLDACRDNPFATRMVVTGGRGRSVGRGLAQVEPPGDMLVAYAARDGQVASDGDGGGNSPYATAILKHIETPGLEIQFLFRKVRDAVLASTGNVQQPHVYGSLGGEPFYLVPPPSEPVPPVPAPPPVAAGSGGPDVEVAFWRSVEQSRARADFEEYLRQFPAGVFAGLARNRLAALPEPGPVVQALPAELPPSVSDGIPPVPPPAVTAALPPAAPPTAPASGLRERVDALMRGLPCAALDVRVAGGEVRVSGHALKSAELERASREVRALTGVTKLSARFVTLESFHCPAAELAASLAPDDGTDRGGIKALALRPAQRGAARGPEQPPGVELDVPEGAAFVYVDLYDSDGSVRHLWPRSAADKGPPPNGRLPLPGPGRSAGSPPGSRLVMAVASPEPLELGGSAGNDAAAYLAVLRQALARARGASAALTVVRAEPEGVAATKPPAPVGAARPRPPAQAARVQPPAAPQVGSGGARCGEILQRAQLGEPMSDADRGYLRDSCR